MHISYLEIYNETGYDLLNPDREVQMLEDLPKVAIMEDEESNIHMRNLSIHRANNEEEALNLVSVAMPLTSGASAALKLHFEVMAVFEFLGRPDNWYIVACLAVMSARTQCMH